MAKQDSQALAEALRANLRRRKERIRAAHQTGDAPTPVGSGADEEGDMREAGDVERPGGWVSTQNRY